MTWKQFQQWCDKRARDGCWGYQESILCIDVMKMIRQLPFWKRARVLNQIKHRMMVEVITPTNKKIEELLDEEA